MSSLCFIHPNGKRNTSLPTLALSICCQVPWAWCDQVVTDIQDTRQVGVCVYICIYIKKFKQPPWDREERLFHVQMYVTAGTLQAWTRYFLFKAGQFHLRIVKNLSILYLSSLFKKKCILNHPSFYVQQRLKCLILYGWIFNLRCDPAVVGGSSICQASWMYPCEGSDLPFVS